MNAQEILDRRARVVPKALPCLSDVVVASAEGSFLVDVGGERILDFATGIGTMMVGHSQKAVVDAAVAQLRTLQHTCIHVATYEPYVALCEKLVVMFPHGPATKALLLNSGAEAVENAVKIARQATGRTGVICFSEAFHGRTLLCMSLTSKVGYKQGCGPFAPEIYRLRFPNHFAYGDGLSEQAFVERELLNVRQAFTHTVDPKSVAAVLIESLQGEGGFVPCPREYLRGLRALCDEHGILLVIDEVQSGFGRTGSWAGYEHAGVTPDLSTWAKAMGGGLPISAVVGKAHVMDAAAPGTVGGTYGGNPVACAAALAAIALMQELDMPARARRVGERVLPVLLALKARCTPVADVRGLGAMLAMELRDGTEPAKGRVTEIIRRCRADGLLLLSAGSYGNIIRLLPPLTISDADLDGGLKTLRTHTEAVCA